ncbi:beta-ketoacyl synthase-like protein [Kushneria sinocarnis]|uniref:Beta-ketoacyl synthase-like protein n=1 Tax=Kushneria sinocarnis TaxID=595502 RepID=A0A420WX78_9GAMM|nr:beta-ketoacyl synthase chain length factor [Kushneria sinocarnis]RKR04336.1 beta-ketoacyl synthase-like protein [Kushneria sinocarnis]
MPACPPASDLQLYLRDWRGWLPGSAVTDNERIDVSDQPAANHIPAMLRRRLTPLGRAVCGMLHALGSEAEGIPILHASRHGDGHRPLDMLDTIATGDGVSPARFSLSVHNAIVGVHSIASGHHAPMAAIAATGDEFAALLEESLGYLADGQPEVIAVFSDSPLPTRYRAADIAPETPAAVALRFSSRQGRRLHERPLDHAAAAETITPPRVIDWLCRERSRLTTARPPCCWTLEAPLRGMQH